MSGIKVVFGASGPLWSNDDSGLKVLEILKEEGIKDLDSARGYGDIEEKLGQRGAAKDFIISTKFSGAWFNISATQEEIAKSAATSFELLKTDQVDIFYIHAPDRTTPFEETLTGINELYKQGRFRRFGLSNFSPEEVKEVIRIAKEKGYVVPTIYQGFYSPVSRKQHALLFPVLRKYNIAFYAYSPLAGGFLTKPRAQLESAPSGRFDGNMPYATLFSKPSYFEALSKWEVIGNESGIPKAELAYRWVAHNSPLKRENGDAIIFGASSLEQVRQTVQGIKRGPLSDKVAKQIDEVWELVKDDAGLDTFNLNNA
ncbi:NADP-dependent oxidoreductase domain-containing protein [Halenospora varia]|nr:NADP-dependent oxidoreductase domain-containing protein [Halenospora varia]